MERVRRRVNQDKKNNQRKKMRISKEQIEQASITAVVTFIVTIVGVTVFNVNAAIYSGIVAGLSVTIGKEYDDSLIIENHWHWSDVVPGVIGVTVGLLMSMLLYWMG